MARKKVIGYRYRCADKGHYVTEAFARENPKTTVREAIHEEDKD